MKLENLDEVTELRRVREQAVALMGAARDNLPGHWQVWPKEGPPIWISTVISNEYVIQAIIEGCHDRIVDIDRRLTELGVSAPRHEAPDRDIASLRRDLEMYVRAWVRELGGSIRNKTHLIDALVLTTEGLRKRAEQAEELLRRAEKAEALVREMLKAAPPAAESDRSAA